MKANEIEDGTVLMIGDLVIGCIETDTVGEATYKIPCKVTDINYYGDVSCDALKPFPDELDWQDGDDFSWIEAIPLTTEILEKNGFESTSAPSERVWKRNGQEVWLDNEGKNYWANIKNGEFYFEGYIEHVHELQHALRLCGIEKEITI